MRLALLVIFLLTFSVNAFAAFPDGWGRRVEIIIQASKVNADQTNFPSLFDVTNFPSELFGAAGSNQALDGGGDVRFSTDEAGINRLAVDIVSWDSTNSTCQVWVKVPAISSSVNTSIYAWYHKAGESQPARDAAFGSEAVWSNGYVAVWHMDESSGGAVDATATGANLTESGSPTHSVAMQIGDGVQFDAATEYMSMVDITALHFANSYTLSVWYEVLGVPGSGWGRIVTKTQGSGSGTDDWALTSRGVGGVNNAPVTRRNSSSGTLTLLSGTARLTNDVSYQVARYSHTADSLELWLNGAFVLQGFDSGTQDDSNEPLSVGGHLGDATRYAIGVIDEIHIANVERSDEWIEAEYENQNTPSTFAIEQTPETPVFAEGFNPRRRIIYYKR